MLEKESIVMRFFRKIGMRNIAWSLRRLHVPVSKKALVLEIGAGGNPYPRANILLDGFEVSSERIENKLVSDRPFVLGLCEKLPFRDKVFDFVIVSHVLEHTDDPDSFLCEVQRVSKAGYIETPDAFFERINPYTYHRLEVTSESKKIIIKKKTSWKIDSEIVELYERKLKKDPTFQHYIRVSPDSLYMRFYWADGFEYNIVNSKDSASWDYPIDLIKRIQPSNKYKDRLRSLYLWLFRKIFSQNYRNSKINLLDLLRCVKCEHSEFTNKNDSIICNKCAQIYPVVDGVPNMILKDFCGANKVRFQAAKKEIEG